jgi:hypothetical protein
MPLLGDPLVGSERAVWSELEQEILELEPPTRKKIGFTASRRDHRNYFPAGRTDE